MVSTSHGLSLSKAGSLENIAFRLLDTLNRSKYRTLLFDPREGGVANNFRRRGGAFYKGKGTEARQISPVGEGTLQIDPFGVLTITRTISEAARVPDLHGAAFQLLTCAGFHEALQDCVPLVKS